MPIFLDTGNISEIERFHKMGIIRGVTTNPTILLKEGITGGLAGIQSRTVEIANMIAPLPLSVEVTSNSPEVIFSQASEFSGWAPNINVKVTIHGPKGETENLRVIHELESKHDIRVNVTAMMSAQQCFLAAQAGASYVSLFGGRVNNMGYDSITEIKILRNLLDKFNLSSKIIIGSTREVLNVLQWLNAGAHIVTCNPKFIEGMLIHPYTKETVQMFIDDGKKLISE